MAAGTDYAQQTVGVNAIDDETITGITRIVCYDQPIYEDTLVEGDEWLGLTLDVDRASVFTNVRPLYEQAAILVQDNDSRLHNTIITSVARMSASRNTFSKPPNSKTKEL